MPLIGAHDLASALHGERPPLLLDVRWRLVAPPAGVAEPPVGERGLPGGLGDHLEAHLPGAVFVDLATELAGPASPERGRHPLPGREDFAAAVARWGLADGQEAVVYDDQGGLSAARAWWLLRHAGLPVRLLDGGIQAWIAAGGDVEEGPVTPPAPARPADVGWGHLPVLDADGAVALAASGGALLDARAGERYRGEVEPIDPRAGHLPGALSLPTADNLGPGRRFLSRQALRERFAAAGVGGDGRAVGVYCGSGITASHEILALEEAGVRAALYPGSFSQYSSDPARPVAVGAEAGRR